ncbi:MFS transporter [Halovenus sp. WSH3]|uniref:MFS transporter n=1 Tax=Halovenus carboxidivorans TaxID=2692199 RepID=A0A6B0T897_9EURY|nr:MFS transporter [Halovenus carboxidivorans]MXR51431.1 MFS transporter [Halovenus carboxidivorans]
MSVADPPVDGSPRRGLAAATLGFFVGFAGVAVIGPVGEAFRSAMGLSGLWLGLLVGAPSFVGSVLRIPFAAWVERAGSKRPLLVLLCLSVLGMAGLAAVLVWLYPDGLSMAHYPLVFLCATLTGCGVASFSVGAAGTSYWYPADSQGTALAVYGGVGNSSPGLFTIVLPLAVGALGVVASYLLWLGFLVVGTVVYAVSAVDAPYFQYRSRGEAHERAREQARADGQELFPSGDATEAFRRAAGTARTWALVALYFISFGGFLALTVWLPSYWSEFHGLDARTAGLVTALAFTLFATVCRVPGGRLTDRFGGERVAAVSFAFVALGAALFVLAGTLPAAVVAALVVGLGVGVANAAVFKLVPEYVPDAVGGASGLVGGLGGLGGFVFPPILGAAVDISGRAGYGHGFVLYLALGVVGVVLCWQLRRYRPTSSTARAAVGTD